MYQSNFPGAPAPAAVVASAMAGLAHASNPATDQEELAAKFGLNKGTLEPPKDPAMHAVLAPKVLAALGMHMYMHMHMSIMHMHMHTHPLLPFLSNPPSRGTHPPFCPGVEG